jgi:hypothetical protein
MTNESGFGRMAVDGINEQPHLKENDVLTPLRMLCADAALMLVDRLANLDPRSERAMNYRQTVKDLITDIAASK